MQSKQSVKSSDWVRLGQTASDCFRLLNRKTDQKLAFFGRRLCEGAERAFRCDRCDKVTGVTAPCTDCCLVPEERLNKCCSSREPRQPQLRLCHSCLCSRCGVRWAPRAAPPQTRHCLRHECITVGLRFSRFFSLVRPRRACVWPAFAQSIGLRGDGLSFSHA